MFIVIAGLTGNITMLSIVVSSENAISKSVGDMKLPVTRPHKILTGKELLFTRSQTAYMFLLSWPGCLWTQ